MNKFLGKSLCREDDKPVKESTEVTYKTLFILFLT